jgi:uncharacterized cupin superfamily protein
MSQDRIPSAIRALDVLPPATGSLYPEPFASMVAGREKRRLGEQFGLANYGVNLCKLSPGSVSSMRHHHSTQDEFIYILEGTPTLVTDSGSMTLEPGMCAGFKAGNGDAHQLRNDSVGPVTCIEIGDRSKGDQVVYPGVDLALHEEGGKFTFTHKNKEPYTRSG